MVTSCKNDKIELQMISSCMELHIVANWMVTYHKISFNVTINYVVHATRRSLTCFYIFKGNKIKNDYIKHFKKRNMHGNLQTKARMITSFLFKEFLSFCKRSILGGIFQSNQHLLILDGHQSHVIIESI
jgi:intergrase/recombinase